MGNRLLLVVTDTFAHTKTPIGPALELSPLLIAVGDDDRTPAEWWPDYPRVRDPHPKRVELRRPDGAVEMVACRLASIHFNSIDPRSDKPPGFKPRMALACHLPNARPE